MGVQQAAKATTIYVEEVIEVRIYEEKTVSIYEHEKDERNNVLKSVLKSQTNEKILQAEHKYYKKISAEPCCVQLESSEQPTEEVRRSNLNLDRSRKAIASAPTTAPSERRTRSTIAAILKEKESKKQSAKSRSPSK